MADIELVIKISKEVYEEYKSILPMLGDVGMDMIAQSIANGEPLPKGHGRLIDADALIKNSMEIFCEDCDRRRGMKNGKLTKKFVYEIGDVPCRACDIGDMIDCVDATAVVIPADKDGD
jgi:hypothetical protein